ncbi:hypothetical protein COCNU_scaffold004260G000020 [Cocos nucifera]|nr:hypothetical protein [Cocos nucifera]
MASTTLRWPQRATTSILLSLSLSSVSTFVSLSFFPGTGVCRFPCRNRPGFPLLHWYVALKGIFDKTCLIGVEGEFDDQEPEYEETRDIVILPEHVTIPFPSVELPEKAGAERKEQLASWTAEKKKVSAYAMNLQQINNGVVVPPSGWKCSKCEKTDNLWLNLTDGMILCGRRNWDGSGGNNHAIEHYKETNYPLAVKLGTITADLEGAGNAFT